MDLVEGFGYFKKHRGWALLIGLINLVGIVYGFYYYAAQFARTPWYFWLFVPDSPLAVLWAELALLAYWLKRPSATLEALGFIGNVQVGLWTVYALLAYAPAFGTLDFLHGGSLSLNSILLVGHAGMAVLGLIFLEGLRQRRESGAARAAWIGIGVAAAYYFVNDVLDYFGPDYQGRGCGLRPYTIPCDPALEPVLTGVTFGLTLLAAVSLVVYTRPRRTP